LDSIKRGTEATIRGYRKWDVDAILAPRAENCTYHLLPESIGVPPRSNAEYREWYTTQIIPLFKEFKVSDAYPLVVACH
jgi:hypothetical protein